MGWVDREHLPVLAEDWRYTRLINLTKRKLRVALLRRLAGDLKSLEEQLATQCTCNQGQVTVKDSDGNEYTVPCSACDGSGTIPAPEDNEDNGQAGR